jgi:hypothetical protein
MNYQTEPVTMWFDRRIVLRKSTIEGIGTFAIGDIQAGETLIWVTGGIVYTSEDWRSGKVQLEPKLYNEAKLADNLFVATPVVFQYYVNHCCSPNAIDISHNPFATHYVAWRDIHPNEEITTDYGLYGEATITVCECKSPLCRGHVTPDDWQLPELQHRYQGNFQKSLEKRIQEMNSHENNSKIIP